MSTIYLDSVVIGLHASAVKLKMSTDIVQRPSFGLIFVPGYVICTQSRDICVHISKGDSTVAQPCTSDVSSKIRPTRNRTRKNTCLHESCLVYVLAELTTNLVDVRPPAVGCARRCSLVEVW